MALVLLLVGLTLNAAIAVLALSGARKLVTFALLFVIFGLTLWGVANFLADTPGIALLWSRLAFVGPLIATLASYHLILELRSIRGVQRLNIGLWIGTIIMIVLVMSSYVVLDVQTRQSGGYDPTYGEGYIAFIIWALVLVVAYAYAAYVPIDNEAPRLRHQLTVVRRGTMSAITLAILVNLVLPNLLQTSFYAQFTPIIGVVYTVVLAFAIVKLGFLDIKLAVVRSVAYILSLAVLAVAYYIIAYLIAIVIFRGNISNSFSLNPLNIFLALGLAFIFQPIRTFFDKLTNSIFYRDRYDSEQFYGSLGDILTMTTDLRLLLRRVSGEVGSTLKASQVFMCVRLDQKRYIRGGTSGYRRMSDADIHIMDQYITENESGIVVAELLYEESLLTQILRGYKVAIVVPLFRERDILGYLCLGDHQTKGYSSRDIKVLDNISSELAVSISNLLAIEEIRNLNNTLEQRIASATKALRESNRQLKRLDEAKTEFVSMASHQLRTPLTSIKGYLDMLLQGDFGKVNGTQRTVLSEAFLSSERMVALINDFLNVSRLQTGRFVIDRSTGDLKEVVRDQVAMLQVIAKQYGLTIEVEIDDEVPMMSVDIDKLRQVVLNFIDNAIYYSKPNTKILVSLTKERRQVVLTVKDTGIGVPESEKSQLFGRFFRAENARLRRPDGTGVGLFLAKKIVLLHGGQIIFESEEGKGSTFGFRLPIASQKQSAKQEV